MSLPLTKFRVPRPRRDAVRREALLTRLRALIADHPVTLISAPAGSGKSTLMAQLIATAPPEEGVVWVALDDDDDHPARLLATLTQSLALLGLAWATDPRTLVANVTGGGSEARAVVAGIVNALCTASLPRVTWLLDDVQRVTDPGAASVLDALIERLPEHVALVLGSRVEPALPLARLRAHGELGELGADDLRFDAREIVALASSRWGSVPPPELVHETLARTCGWAVGVNLLLASIADAGSAGRELQRDAPPRALFDFLAEEVLDELPPTLRDFALDCAVLPELDPSRCDAVTGRADSRAALDELLRRHLFLSVVDEHEPVLRFHDLFRDFLLARLARGAAEHRRELHARAAAAEDIPERAIAHWLDAERWSEAIGLITRHGLRLAAEGAYASLERWTERLPADAIDASPQLALLRTECAWARWDWERVLRFAPAAAAGLARLGDLPGQLRAQVLLAAALGALGHLDERAALTEQSLALDPPACDAAQFHLQRAWSAFSLGEIERVAEHLARMNALVAEDPPHHAPLVAQTFNCHFGGLPGVTAECLRFVALCDSVPKRAAMPWHSTPIVAGAWAALWQGRISEVGTALERIADIRQRFGAVRYVVLDATHLQALHLAVTGRHERARQLLEALLAELGSVDSDGLRHVWQRPYGFVLARTLWMALDREALAARADSLCGPLRPREWPFVAGAADTLAGQAALLEGRLDAARAALESAVRRYARHPAPAFQADPRIALAEVHLRRLDPRRAWATLRPVVRDIGLDGTPGRLLLEPMPVVRGLLASCPPEAPEAGAVGRLLEQLDECSRATLATLALPSAMVLPAFTARLTDREREVIELVAQGMPNKILARQLSLSPHTVKRHLANILNKLDCDNRVQAADLWRRASG